jgi:hypothetical protein
MGAVNPLRAPAANSSQSVCGKRAYSASRALTNLLGGVAGCYTGQPRIAKTAVDNAPLVPLC